jgi:hypothetical protein
MDLVLADEGAPLAVQPAEATMLPVKGHLVRAVRAAEAAKTKAEIVLFCLEHCPRVPGQVLGTGAGLALLGYPWE